MDTGADNNKKTLAILAGLIVLLAIVGYVAYRNMPDNRTIHVKNENPEVTSWFETKAKEVQGDWSKLSPADQQKANEMTRGFGAMGIAKSWEKLQKGG